MTPEAATALSDAGWIVGSNIENRSPWMKWIWGGEPPTFPTYQVIDYQWSDGDPVKEQALKDAGYTLVFQDLWKKVIQS